MATFEMRKDNQFFGNGKFDHRLENLTIVKEDEHGWDCQTQPTNNPKWSAEDNQPSYVGLSKGEWTLMNDKNERTAMANTNKDGLSAHDELEAANGFAVPARKASDTFVCECGQVRSLTVPPGEEAYHRSHYHQYCGRCKCEPCECAHYGLSR